MEKTNEFGIDDGADSVFQILQQNNHPYARYGSWLLFQLIHPLLEATYTNETSSFVFSYIGVTEIHGLGTKLATILANGEISSNIATSNRSTTRCTDIIRYCESLVTESKDFVRKLLIIAQPESYHTSSTNEEACHHLQIFLLSNLQDMKESAISSVETYKKFLDVWEACESASPSIAHLLDQEDRRTMNQTFVWHLFCLFSIETKKQESDLLSIAASLAFLVGILHSAAKSKSVQHEHLDEESTRRNRQATKKRIIENLENGHASIGNDASRTILVVLLEVLGTYPTLAKDKIDSLQNLEVELAGFFSHAFSVRDASELFFDKARYVFINKMAHCYNRAFQAAVYTTDVQWVNDLYLCDERIEPFLVGDENQDYVDFGSNILLKTRADCDPSGSINETALVRRLFTFGSPFILKD